MLSGHGRESWSGGRTALDSDYPPSPVQRPRPESDFRDAGTEPATLSRRHSDGNSLLNSSSKAVGRDVQNRSPAARKTKDGSARPSVARRESDFEPVAARRDLAAMESAAAEGMRLLREDHHEGQAPTRNVNRRRLSDMVDAHPSHDGSRGSHSRSWNNDGSRGSQSRSWNIARESPPPGKNAMRRRNSTSSFTNFFSGPLLDAAVQQILRDESDVQHDKSSMREHAERAPPDGHSGRSTGVLHGGQSSGFRRKSLRESSSRDYEAGAGVESNHDRIFQRRRSIPTQGEGGRREVVAHTRAPSQQYPHQLRQPHQHSSERISQRISPPRTSPPRTSPSRISPTRNSRPRTSELNSNSSRSAWTSTLRGKSQRRTASSHLSDSTSPPPRRSPSQQRDRHRQREWRERGDTADARAAYPAAMPSSSQTGDASRDGMRMPRSCSMDKINKQESARRQGQKMQPAHVSSDLKADQGEHDGVLFAVRKSLSLSHSVLLALLLVLSSHSFRRSFACSLSLHDLAYANQHTLPNTFLEIVKYRHGNRKIGEVWIGNLVLFRKPAPATPTHYDPIHHTHTRTHMIPQKTAYQRARAHTNTYTTRTYSFSKHTLACARTHTRTHTDTHAYTHTHARTHTHTPKNTHTHTQTDTLKHT